jgi:DNA polymerase-3 subunit delta'
MAQLFSAIGGHQANIQKLLKALQQDHLAQTMIFAGPSGIGKKKVAVAMAQALLCETLQKGSESKSEALSANVSMPCGQCGPCTRVASGNSENIFLLKTEKAPIKIDQCREVLEYLSLRALGKKRVVIIDQAHWMNPSAANAMLKIFEEPPEDSYFILITSSMGALLPTIKSRGQVVRFSPPSIVDMKRFKKAPEWAFRASLGSFESLELLTHSDEQELRELAGVSLMNLVEDPWFYLTPEFKELGKDRTAAQRIIHFWCLLLRDAMLFQKGERDSLINADQTQALAVLGRWNERALLKVTERAFELESALAQNRDATLLCEEFWLLSLEDIEKNK